MGAVNDAKKLSFIHFIGNAIISLGQRRNETQLKSLKHIEQKKWGAGAPFVGGAPLFEGIASEATINEPFTRD